MARIVSGPEITGLVINKQTGTPIGGATITVSQTVYTDPDFTAGTTTLTADGYGVFFCYAGRGTYTFTTTAVGAAAIEPVTVRSGGPATSVAALAGPNTWTGTQDFTGATVTGIGSSTVSPKAYGAKGDARTVADAVVTSGSTTVTSATAAFTSADGGKRYIITDPALGSTQFAAGTLTYVNATTITLSSAPAFALNPATLTVATDDTTAITNAIAAAAPSGGTVLFDAAGYGVTSQITVPGAVRLLGVGGFDYAAVNLPIVKGSYVVAMAAITGALVQLGSDPTSSVSGQTGATAENMGFEGNSVADAALKTGGRRNRVRNCQVWRGKLRGLAVYGQNGNIVGTIVGQNNQGDVCHISGFHDNKIVASEFRQASGGSAQLRLTNCGPTLISGCHLYSGANGTVSGTTANDIFIEGNDVSDVSIVNNEIEGCNGIQILVKPDASATLGNFTITGNVFYQVAGFPDNTYPVMRFDLSNASSAVKNVLMSSNSVRGNGNAGRYKALIEQTGAGTAARIACLSNIGTDVVALFSGITPTIRRNNAMLNSTVTLLSNSNGQSTFSGTGAQTAFTIAHGLNATPTSVTVTAGSSAAAGTFYATVDGTNITVTFGTAPVSGASNVVLNWTAQL